MPTDGSLTDAVTVVLAFNDAINCGDVAALSALMTADHRFIDAAGATTDGRDACVQAWRAFFDTFPDYRNVFEDITDGGDGVVIVSGRSECSVAALDGPAAWRAVVLDRRVDVWQVSEPSSDAC